MVMRVLRRVDNTATMAKLRGCPHDIVFDGHMICEEQFLVYNTCGKKHRAQVMTVFLHPNIVVVARRRKERCKGTYLEFCESLDVRNSVCLSVCLSIKLFMFFYLDF